MEKIVSGRKRNTKKTVSYTVFGDVLFVLGIAAMGFMLYRSNDYSAEKVKDGDGYVQVMSVGAYQEELETAEKPTFSAGQSFFDSVGEFFAELIFGENERDS